VFFPPTFPDLHTPHTQASGFVFCVSLLSPSSVKNLGYIISFISLSHLNKYMREEGEIETAY